MKKKILYVGLDVHKKSIDVALANGRANGKVRSYGKIDGSLDALDKLIGKLQSKDCVLEFVYEAGPCGYPIYRHLEKDRRKHGKMPEEFLRFRNLRHAQGTSPKNVVGDRGFFIVQFE